MALLGRRYGASRRVPHGSKAQLPARHEQTILAGRRVGNPSFTWKIAGESPDGGIAKTDRADAQSAVRRLHRNRKTSAAYRLDPFDAPLPNDRYLRIPAEDPRRVW
jgi:hypothetical protein